MQSTLLFQRDKQFKTELKKAGSLADIIKREMTTSNVHSHLFLAVLMVAEILVS